MGGQVFHASVIEAVPQLKLLKVLERRTNLSPKRYPWVKVVYETGGIPEDEEIELVLIATPNLSHFDYAQQALKANKHVVADKPFTKQNWREEAEEPGSRILYDIGSHLIDQALVLFGILDMATAGALRKHTVGMNERRLSNNYYL
ncbi:hypothetical protein R1sor_016220 [Riccia sorocarpa]|uniref:Gfo/Idh/MocA-like oxidoreductase N-terminal domain-containing protein n=1 Tax=Riccia sorocarpa TaxID=122646 RepID=A0ABD3HG78_9MARC